MPGRLIDTMSHEQFVDYINSAFMNSKGITVYNEENPAPNIHTDWQRESINSCKPVQDYSLSLDGTSGDTQYMLSEVFICKMGCCQALNLINIHFVRMCNTSLIIF